jgi:anthranilate synthase component 2
MLLMIDNYDSFTYNIVQYLGELGQKPEVVRNDQISLDELRRLDVERLFVSPGPCSPKEAGISCEAIRHFSEIGVPVFGVCLGHQCIGDVFGANVVHAPYLMHGKVSAIRHSGTDVFRNIPSPFNATRYHSLTIAPESVAGTPLEVTAETDDHVIMGVRHRTLPVYGVQFHPESILTEHGHALLQNFLEL